MFESIRKHSKFVMILLFLLIIPSFIFVGVDQSYFSGSSPTVARVAGQDITQNDWDNAHRYETDRLRAENPAMDAKFLDSAQARYATLERMVRDRVFQTAAQKLNLLTSDSELARTLQAMPAIANLRKPDGSLDAEGYRALLASQGMTPEAYEASLRRQLSLDKVVGSVASTSVATAATTDVAMDALLQRREIQVMQFDAKQFTDKVKLDEAMLKAYYQANLEKFQQVEQADVEYVVLDLPSVLKTIELNEADLQSYYKQNAERLSGGQEERRASHILFNAPRSLPASEREQVKVKAQALVDQIKAAPESFAQMAKEQSQDTGSAVAGGDLGFFGRGAMVPEFEKAVFAMETGAISDVVDSEFGFHIIQLTEVKKPEIPSFASVRDKIEKELKTQQAQRKFAEVSETFANTVYEQSESLQPAVEKLGLHLQTAKGVQREPMPGAEGALANSAFLQALFATDSLDNKRNTDAVEFGSNQMVAGRIANYQPAKQLAFEEVAERVKALYVEEQAIVLAKAAGEAQLKALREGQAADANFAAPVTVSRDVPGVVAPAVLVAALQAKTDNLPAYEGVSVPGTGYAIAKVNKIVAQDEKNAEISRQAALQYVQLFGIAESAAYYEMLKKKFDVQIKVAKP